MNDTEEVKTLIDKAAEVCGSKKALAEELGVFPQHLSQWATGKRSCLPDDVAAIAVIAGYDAMKFLARATVKHTEGTKKGLILARGLGKSMAVIGAVIATTGANATVSDFIRCIERLNPKRHIDRYTLSELAA